MDQNRSLQFLRENRSNVESHPQKQALPLEPLVLFIRPAASKASAEAAGNHA